MSFVHKKHKELAHLLKSGGERGPKGVKVTDYKKRLNGVKWKERKGGKEVERERGGVRER